MSDLLAFWLAKAERKTASERRESASYELDLRYIKERLAEMKSQHDPLAELMTKPMTERDRLYAAAFWVVVGRFP